MERVAFMVEATGERLGCLLNPESLVVRRTAGVRARTSAGGKLTGAALNDDPLLFTGGGTTELDLDLLFDVQVAGSTIRTSDVRDLTRPLWELAENRPADVGKGSPPLVRFVWGKTWNTPGVVTAVAERLEQFNQGGAPARSWLRMRLTRVGEPDAAPLEEPSAQAPWAPVGDAVPEEQVLIHPVLGGGGDEAGERLEDIAFLYYGDPSAWRVIASFNGIADPTSIAPGTVLRVPPIQATTKGPA